MKPIRSVETPQSIKTDPGFDADALMAAASDAVRQALARHKANGNAVVVWRNGRVVLLQPDEIEV